ncbi:hypothetical protein AB0F88_39050 [Streptosporangium sp. NPDC023963]|uniref:hypothetical protein n=1 Tax=Streptosporangium sp. NPDC023963 TaxID=3155608 RepID=UPI0034202EFF
MTVIPHPHRDGHGPALLTGEPLVGVPPVRRAFPRGSSITGRSRQQRAGAVGITSPDFWWLVAVRETGEET